MRGRPTCPTEQKKNSVGATGGSPLFLLLQGKVGYQIAPSSDPALPAHLPPKGKALGVGASLSDYNTHPSQPAQLGGGPLRALVHGPQARQKKERTPAGSPQTRKGGSREEEPLPPWCSFLRLSSKESRAPARGRAGNGALRPEASKKPRPPKGYAVPRRPPPPGAPPLHVSGSGSPRMVASGWKMAQKKSLSRARISRSSR